MISEHLISKDMFSDNKPDTVEGLSTGWSETQYFREGVEGPAETELNDHC